MAHDLVIRNGLLVDGTGAAPFRGDLAIDGDTISAVGSVDEPGRREIDASGHHVTPGFVDIHTHLDAQIGWDPWLTPISWHGVTSALIGNCGVTFAPVREGDAATLANMMETVEDIPADAILRGLPWTWEGYGGYLDAIEGLAPAINVAGLVGHCAVRFYVMGERAVDEQPTARELEQMAAVVGRSVAEGAVGFSTSRIIGHFLPDGRAVPGTHAEHAELVRIAQAVKAAGGGLMQNVLNLAGDFEGELDLIREEARASGDRVLFSITAGRSDASGRLFTDRIAEMRAEGLDVSGIAIPRGSGFVAGLVNTLPWQHGRWVELAKLDFAGRLAALDDADFVEGLVADAEQDTGYFAKARIPLYWLGDGESPNYRFDEASDLETLAREAGETKAATFLRMSRESRGRALFVLRMFNPNLRAVADLISRGDVFPGLSDAGAHVGQVMDGGVSTFVLSHWVRDEGLFPIEEAVRRLSSAPARVIGLSDRGVLAPGRKADVNVIDLARLGESMPEFVHDFPGGAGRFIQRARGYRATICNGETILEHDEHVGRRAGKVIRR
ncbi:MAG: amidohydrolase family protein [Spirochaetaceae bacterium]|nr:amidohydrolase family protein [Myxococcales bacterium]MCB9726272.1 amidohydrolase family protein [Spirochaetaceae bacterium]HPG25968.1 amidohydrolase family protein [Myxococcota bacterium]